MFKLVAIPKGVLPLQGKRIVIAGDGILGRTCAYLLASAGAKVVIWSPSQSLSSSSTVKITELHNGLEYLDKSALTTSLTCAQGNIDFLSLFSVGTKCSPDVVRGELVKLGVMHANPTSFEVTSACHVAKRPSVDDLKQRAADIHQYYVNQGVDHCYDVMPPNLDRDVSGGIQDDSQRGIAVLRVLSVLDAALEQLEVQRQEGHYHGDDVSDVIVNATGHCGGKLHCELASVEGDRVAVNASLRMQFYGRVDVSGMDKDSVQSLLQHPRYTISTAEAGSDGPFDGAMLDGLVPFDYQGRLHVFIVMYAPGPSYCWGPSRQLANDEGVFTTIEDGERQSKGSLDEQQRIENTYKHLRRCFGLLPGFDAYTHVHTQYGPTVSINNHSCHRHTIPLVRHEINLKQYLITAMCGKGTYAASVAKSVLQELVERCGYAGPFSCPPIDLLKYDRDGITQHSGSLLKDSGLPSGLFPMTKPLNK